MKNIFQFKKLRSYFLVISIIQITILSYFAYQIVMEKYYLSNEISKIGKITLVSTYQSNLIDNLQRERGMSSSFVSSNGKLFADEMITQRKKTDEAISKLLSQYSNLDLNLYSEKIVATIHKTEDELKKLKKVRANIDNFNINPIALRTFYTGIIGSFISNIAKIKETSAIDSDLYDNMATFYNLIEYKERLGRARALFVNILNDKKATDINYKSALYTIGEKDYFYYQFRLSNQKDVLDAFDNQVTGDAINKSNEIISFVIDNKDANIEYDPKVWFANVSAYIELVHKVEKMTTNKIILQTENLVAQNQQKLLIYLSVSIFGIFISIFLAYYLTKNIVNSVNESKLAIIGMSKGQFDNDIYNDRVDELGDLLNAVKSSVDTIKAVNNESKLVIDNINLGNLSYRAKNQGFEGSWSDLITGLNGVIESFIKPIQVTAEKVHDLTNGIVPKEITDDYYGDFNLLKNNLNDLITIQTKIAYYAEEISNGNLDSKLEPRNSQDELIISINKVANTLKEVVSEIDSESHKLEIGDLRARLNTDKFSGSYKGVLESINNALDAVVNFFNLNSNIMIANKERQITFINQPLMNVIKQYENEFKKNFPTFDSSKLIGANIDTFHKKPEYNKNILNSLRETHSAVINVGNRKFSLNINPIVDKNGQTLAFIVNWIDATAQYTFNENLESLSKNLIEGNLSHRIDSSLMRKEYIELSQSINKMVDGVIDPLRVTSVYISSISHGKIPEIITDEYSGDYNTIKNNLNSLINTMNNLINELDNMSKEHELGDIDIFANPDIFEGAFKTLINSTNDLVRSHINVKKQAMNVFVEFGKGNFNADIDKLPGKKIFINNAINAVRDNLVNFNSEMAQLIDAAQRGELSYRANANSFTGDWYSMVSSINSLIDSIVEPINDASMVLSELAQGDLSSRILNSYQGDFEKLKNNINFLSESLDQVLSKVSESVQTTASTTHQLSSAAETMAAAAQEQSAQTDDVASAVEEMSRTITENASSATRTASLAEENGQVAVRGGEVVAETINKMKDIARVVKNTSESIEKLGDSSKAIGEIISVIDDIADQTNLLALNAAIEAARAGEQGRGFAVVADEVRKLAERTSDATKEIAKMIKGIQQETQDAVIVMQTGTKEVENGIKLADEAGNSLKLIVESSQDLIHMITQISAASEEQSATSEEISKNVMSISKVVADSARQIEEIAESSENLSRQTELLSELMRQFNLSSGNRYNNKSMTSNRGNRLLN